MSNDLAALNVANRAADFSGQRRCRDVGACDRLGHVHYPSKQPGVRYAELSVAGSIEPSRVVDSRSVYGTTTGLDGASGRRTRPFRVRLVDDFTDFRTEATGRSGSAVVESVRRWSGLGEVMSLVTA